MRTKTLLLTAALAAAGVATSMAQVYSVNAVGYVKKDIPTGFSIIANPLKNGDNKVSTLFTGVPNGFTVYKFNNATALYSVNGYDAEFGEFDNPDQTLAPGEAAFVRNPSGSTVTVTFVGEVPQGNLSTTIPNGFSLAASQVPQAGLLTTDLKYTPSSGDTVYRFNNATGQYLVSNYDAEFGEWDSEPTLGVGEGFFIRRSVAGAGAWTRNFSVNQ